MSNKSNFFRRPNFSTIRSLIADEKEEEEDRTSNAENIANKEDGDVSENDSSINVQYMKEIELHPDQVTSGAYQGVQKAEAATLVWSKTAVYCTYAWIWVSFFMLALQSAIGNAVIAYAYSNFSSASQVSTAGILATIIGGVIKLPIAKMLNLWGRAEGFLVFVVVYLLGIIIIASCNGPSGYAAGYVLYWIGYDAIYMILDVFIADTSGLKNRAFGFAFASTPFICTAFTGPLAAQSFLKTGGWRWAYGAFAIIMPFVFVPLALVFKFYQLKAEKLGLIETKPSSIMIGLRWLRLVLTGKFSESNKQFKEGLSTSGQSIVFYFHEFDIIGCFLIIAAFVLFLLPFSLQTYGRASYDTPTFIVMVIIGALLFPCFYIWERYFAKVHFIRWELLKQRTVIGACCLAAILYFSFYSWELYYYYFVMVVYDLNVSMTGYMTQIYNVGSCFWGVVFGLWVRYIKTFKWTCFFFGLPLMMLGAGLMIHFRGQDGDIGYIIMCQIFIAFAGGTLVIGEDMAVMAASDLDGVPMMLSLIGLFSSLGGSVGYAVAAAIYTNTFPGALYDALPDSEKASYATIYAGGYLTQMNYPVGSEVRNAINYAWGYSQQNGCIAATCFLILGFPSVFVWKNYRVDKKQNKGNVM